MTDYGHRRFTDLHGRYIDPDETLTLKQAADKVAEAKQNVDEAYNNDAQNWEAKRLDANRAERIAIENFEAALFRTCGYWLHDLRRIGAI